MLISDWSSDVCSSDLEKIEVLPVANPGQQVDTEQVRERKHRSRLALRVRIHGVSFDRKLGLHQAFDDIDGLPDTGRDKVPKCGDVVIRDMSVGHGPHLAVPEVIARQKVLLVEVALCAIGLHALAVTPTPRTNKE